MKKKECLCDSLGATECPLPHQPPHTPTPLFAESTNGTGIFYLEQVTDQGTIEIATFTIHADGKRNAELLKEDKDRRAFIVRAVNNYRNMLTALKEIIKAQGGDPYAFQKEWSAVKFAIAQAEEK